LNSGDARQYLTSWHALLNLFNRVLQKELSFPNDFIKTKENAYDKRGRPKRRFHDRSVSFPYVLNEFERREVILNTHESVGRWPLGPALRNAHPKTTQEVFK